MNSDWISFSKPTIMEHEIKEALHFLISDSLHTTQSLFQFQEALKNLYPFSYCLALSSYDTALLLSLHLLNLNKDHYILLPLYSPFRLTNLLERLGYKVIYADINPSSGVLDSSKALELLQGYDVAAIFIDFPFFYDDQIKPLLKEDIPLIIDFSTLFGLSLDDDFYNPNHKVVGLFSHHHDQIITTGGKGCSLFLSYKEYAQKLDETLNLTKPHLFIDLFMTDLQATLGLVQYQKLNDLLTSRYRIADEYHQTLGNQAFISPDQLKKGNATYYPIKLGSIDIQMFQSIFFNNKVQTQKRYDFDSSVLSTSTHKEYPHSTFLFEQLVGIPIYPTLTKQEIKQISTILSRIY